MMSKSYTVRENLNEIDRGNLKIFSDTLAHLLFHRGIKSEKEANAFMSPNYEKHINDPFLLLGMEKAVTRILKAVKKQEKIAIFSDYDADGIPGAVVLHDFFKLIGFNNFLNYIPDRQEEGFGLSCFAIEEIKKQGAMLLITIDCGITALEEVDFANSLGIDVIITDHHLPADGGIPKSIANINPKISPDYPEQMLCGAGVIFKVVQAILLKNRFGLTDGAEKWLLDMVGIATLSDMVPIQGENRAFACFGLLVLRKTRRVGLLRLLKTLKIDPRRITEDDVGFMITPRINAASRMGISYDAFKLLTTTDEAEAEILVKNLEKANTERKSTTAYLAKEVRKMIEAKYSPYFSNKVIVAGNPAWQPSILGLVAGSLAESESKPVFLWGKEGSKEELKGSCRGIAGVSVSTIMSAVPSGVFLNFGGHHQAGGFSVSYESVHLLDEEIEKAFLKAGDVGDKLESFVDFSVDPESVNDRLLRDLEKLAPFGIENAKPTFLINGAKVDDITFFGKEKNHLKLIIKRDYFPLEAICFFVGADMLKKVEKGMTVKIVGNIERNFFGRNSVRVRIIDIV